MVHSCGNVQDCPSCCSNPDPGVWSRGRRQRTGQLPVCDVSGHISLHAFSRLRPCTLFRNVTVMSEADVLS